MYRIKLIIVFLLISWGYSNAQQHIKTIGVKDGLSSPSINFIFNDSRGFIWIATADEGLCRYDGLDIKVYTKNTSVDSTHIISNNVNCITEDEEGNIWIGTSVGVSCFDGNKFKNFDDKNGLKCPAVYGIKAVNKKIYIATQGAGVAVYANKQFSYLNKASGLPDDTVFSIESDLLGNLYFGTQKEGIVQYKDGKYLPLKGNEKIKNDVVFCLKSDFQNQLWAGTISGKFYRVFNQEVTEIKLPVIAKNDFIGSIGIDRNDHKWIATAHGALKYDNKEFTFFDKTARLNSDLAQAILCDNQNNVWIGTNVGVCIFGNDPFLLLNEKNGLENTYVQNIFKDKNNNLIISTLKEGLYIMKGNYFKPLITGTEIDQSIVTTALVINENTIVIGTESNGIFITDHRFNIKKQIKDLNNTVLNEITRIAINKQGDIYVSSYGAGVCKISLNGEVKLFTTKNGALPSNNVLSIAQIEDNKFVIAYFGHDVTYFDGEKAQFINSKTGTVYSIEKTAGTLFFGTGEKGLAIFQDGKTKFINTSNGLTSNNIQALNWDSLKSQLWVCTNKGLNIIPFDKNMNAGEVINLAQKNSPTGNTLVTNSILRDDATLWIGSLEGLIKHTNFDGSIKKIIPTVRIKEVKVNNLFFDWSKAKGSIEKWNKTPLNATLNYNQNQLLISYAASSSSIYISYQYMLDGLDKTWSPVTNATEVNYSNIQPGTYKFKVRTAMPDGSKGEISKFEITIIPPIWLRWWFWVSIILIVVAGLYTYIRYREMSLIKDKKQLENEVALRTIALNDSNKKLEGALHDIHDSITYAKRIQSSILPPINEIAKAFNQSFVFFQPKDIVSGDFYWFYESEQFYFICAADCTGHGVPGSLMSMLGSQALTDGVMESTEPGKILQLVNQGIKKALRQTNEEDSTRDGMDLALCRFDKQLKAVTFAGANRPLWLIRSSFNLSGSTKEELLEYKATKSAIGGLTSTEQEFEQQTINLLTNDTIFIFTDGLADQFGGALEKNAAEGKKLKTKNLKEKLLDINTSSMPVQKNALETFFNAWKGQLEQTDDVLIIGIKV